MNQLINCCCGSSQSYTDCCHPFIKQQQKPTTAEQLMRSRYSAYCHNEAQYLFSTHQSENLKLADIQQTIDQTQWLGLTIVHSKQGTKYDAVGWVEFIAFYQDDGIKQLHENSYFTKSGEQWLYISGDQLPPVKLKRNDPCFCASGKKYKKCHGI